MRILIDIGHPAHVHFFKNLVQILSGKGHQILITARDKDVAFRLLDSYGFRYEKMKGYPKNLFAKIVSVLPTDWKLYRIGKKFSPDILLGFCSINASHASALLKKPCVLFDDDEYHTFSTYLFTKTACTFHNCRKNLGQKQVTINGFKELAYLHPRYFTPDPTILSGLNLTKESRFAVLRFVAWQASHDFGQHGFDMTTKRRLVKELERYAKVFISSEAPLPDEFEQYKIPISPEKLHDLLYYATLLIGDSQTMTTEAAVLGTPAIRCNSWVGPNDMGNFVELENVYNLIYSFQEPDKAIQKAIELIQQPDLKDQWEIKRQRLLDDKVDVTGFMVDFIENYPESFRK